MTAQDVLDTHFPHAYLPPEHDSVLRTEFKSLREEEYLVMCLHYAGPALYRGLRIRVNVDAMKEEYAGTGEESLSEQANYTS